MICVVATDKNGAIGRDGNLLFHIPEDLKHFRRLTEGKTIILGRKTLDTFPNKKPLVNRKNIILSRNKDYTCKDAIVCNSIDQLLQMVKNIPNDEVVVVGGESIYKLLEPHITCIYLTEIYEEVEDADTFFFSVDKWKKEPISEKKQFNGIEYQFFKLIR